MGLPVSDQADGDSEEGFVDVVARSQRMRTGPKPCSKEIVCSTPGGRCPGRSPESCPAVAAVEGRRCGCRRSVTPRAGALTGGDDVMSAARACAIDRAGSARGPLRAGTAGPTRQLRRLFGVRQHGSCSAESVR